MTASTDTTPIETGNSPDAGRTAFVLAGGGSLGAVQVGMLQALGAAGVAPDLLVGTSAGAINAAWVAGQGTSARSLTELARIWQAARRGHIFPVHPAQVVQAILGNRLSLTSSDELGSLVRREAGYADLNEAVIELHMVATDLLTGEAVLLSAGPLDDAVRASAAIPGLLPPVLIQGRHLVDGGVAHSTGVAQAIELGATTIWVLPTGYPCALARPPRTALGVAMRALTLLTEQRLISEVETRSHDVTIKVLPPLCPLAISAADFTHAAELIERAREGTRCWLADGGPDRPGQHLILSLHGHEQVPTDGRHRGERHTAKAPATTR